MWGMRHKTKDPKFLIGFVVALVVQALVIGLYVGTVLMGPETPPPSPAAVLWNDVNGQQIARV